MMLEGGREGEGALVQHVICRTTRPKLSKIQYLLFVWREKYGGHVDKVYILL